MARPKHPPKPRISVGVDGERKTRLDRGAEKDLKEDESRMKFGGQVLGGMILSAKKSPND